jgi:pyruvate kinase
MPKRTKIVCTIGPASQSVETLSAMIRSGMNVARLNFSHGSYENHAMLIKNVRQAAEECGVVVGLLQDLQGPKIRVGKLPEAGVELKKDESIILTTGSADYSEGHLPVQYKELHKDVKAGDRILLDDGNMEVAVENVSGNDISCKIIIGGKLISFKGITVPTASLSTSALSKKDKEDLVFGLKQGVDFVAISFVRRADDIKELRELIINGLPEGSSLPLIIAKIEKHEALVNLDEIVAETDGIMVARGDLALETRASEVPIWQKKMIQKCLEAAKPVITATQMLDSMTHSPRPTRAEISDVANAVIDHTDATMLSQESAMGKYPVETVTTMADIARDTEASPLDDMVTLPPMDGTAPPVLAMSAAACEVAKAVGAKAIFVLSRTGFTARAVSRHRPLLPIIAATSNETTRQQLSLSWGVDPYSIEKFCEVREAWGQLSEKLTKKYNLKKGDRIIAVSGLQSDRHNDWDESVRVFEV